MEPLCRAECSRLIPALGWQSQATPQHSSVAAGLSPPHLYCAWKWLCTKLCPQGCQAAGGDLPASTIPSSPACGDKRQVSKVQR